MQNIVIYQLYFSLIQNVTVLVFNTKILSTKLIRISDRINSLDETLLLLICQLIFLSS